MMTREQKLEEALRDVRTWADSQCPCHEETPNPCTLCGASVENLEACKAVESIFPRDLLRKLDAALSVEKEAEAIGFVTQTVLDELRVNRAGKLYAIVPTRQRDYAIPLYTHPSPPIAISDEQVEHAEAEFYRTQGDMRAALEAAFSATPQKSNKAKEVLRLVKEFALLANGWNPEEEDDYKEFKKAIKDVLK